MSKCEICLMDENKILFMISGLNIMRCEFCGLIYVEKEHIRDDFLDIYNRSYYSNKNVKVIGNPESFDFFGYVDYINEKKSIAMTFKKHIINIEKYKEKGRLLDIGCGPGFLLEIAKKRGWDVTGIEVSDFGAEYANQNGLNVLHKELREARFKKSEFDVITLFDVIEHFYEPLKELKEINRILKPDGLLVIITPNSDSLIAKLLGKNWEEFKRAKEHLYFFSKKTLRLILNGAGFKDIGIKSAGRFFTLSSFIQRIGLNNIRTRRLEKILEKIGLNRSQIYINPHSKMICYAIKNK